MDENNVIIELKAVKKGDDIVLHLKDNEGHEHDKTITSEVIAGGTVIWKLMKNSDIQKIVNIYKKSDSQDVFSIDPHSENGSTDWTGVISNSASGVESYNIDYIYKDGSKITDDPVVEAKPPIPPTE